MVICCGSGSMAGQGIFKDMVDGDTYKYYHEGEWKVSTSGKSVGIINPSTLKPLFKVQGPSPSYLILSKSQSVLLPVHAWSSTRMLMMFRNSSCDAIEFGQVSSFTC